MKELKNEVKERKERKQFKLNGKFKSILQTGALLVLLILIFIAAPHCTQATKNAVTWLYELDEEYITRFWTILLSLTSLVTVLFFNNNNK